MANTWILAQQSADEAPTTIQSTPPSDETSETIAVNESDPNTVAPKREPQSPWTMLIWFLPMMIILYLFMFRGPRKQKQEHKQMVQSLSKGDKVRTIGGILGTIVDVKDDEIVLKIDESSNTKIRVTPAAIGQKQSKEK